MLQLTPKEQLTGRGQSLLEVVIALGVFGIILSIGSTLYFGGQSNTLDAAESIRAVDIARTGLEGVRVMRDKNWSDLTDGNHGLVLGANNTWQFSGTSDTVGEFTRQVIVSTESINIKKIKVQVSWQTNRSQQVELVERLTNWRPVQDTGNDTGGTPPSGNWQNPQTLGSIDLGPGNQATDLDVKNKIVYMTATAASSAKPDFFVINATNGQSPSISGSLNTGDGLNGVDTAGNYAYVVGKDDNQEFMVIDISNPANPQKVAGINLPGNADGLTVFYFGGYVYVGRANGAAQEFMIINVMNPLNPQVTGGLSNVGDEINDIYVYNQRAYIGTEDDAHSMYVIDVSNPVAPAVLGSLNINMHVYGIYVARESLVYVGGKTKFYIVDATNPTNIINLGSVTIGSRIRDIALSGTLAFLGTEDSNREFQVWNVANSSNPVLWSFFNFPQVATGVDYEDNLVYVSVRSNDALRIITSQ